VFLGDGFQRVFGLAEHHDVTERDSLKAVETASKTLRELRIAEITQLDMKIENGKVTAYRVKVNLSFKYQPSK